MTFRLAELALIGILLRFPAADDGLQLIANKSFRKSPSE